jgi:hypothetical protein
VIEPQVGDLVQQTVASTGREHIYRLIGIERMPRGWSWWHWRGVCVVCGASFTCRTPSPRIRGMIRTCEAHRGRLRG